MTVSRGRRALVHAKLEASKDAPCVSARMASASHPSCCWGRLRKHTLSQWKRPHFFQDKGMAWGCRPPWPPQALRRGLTIPSCPKPPALSDSPGFLAPPTGLEPQFFWETQPDHHVLSDTAQARPWDTSRSRSVHLARLRSRAPGCQGPCRSRGSAPGPAQSRRSAYDGGVTETSKQSTQPRLAHS